MARKESTTTIVTTASKEFYSKLEVINAIRWAEGLTKTEAAKRYRSTDSTYHNLMVHGFKTNAKKSFYAD